MPKEQNGHDSGVQRARHSPSANMFCTFTYLSRLYNIAGLHLYLYSFAQPFHCIFTIQLASLVMLTRKGLI